MSEPAREAPKRRTRNTRPSAYVSAWIPWQLRAKLAYAAEAAGRTLSAEITERLEHSFRPGEDEP